MNNPIVLHSKAWRVALSSVVAGIFLAGLPALADVPPQSYSQARPATGGDAAVKKHLDEAQTAIRNGNLRLALIALKNAVNSAPRNGPARMQLGMLLLRIGDHGPAERELRQAMRDGAPESEVLPALFQVMLIRNEFPQLLNQFPDPGPDSKSPVAADILKARALALQGQKKDAEASDAMDRSLAYRRDGHGLLTRARLSLMQGSRADALRYADEAIGKSASPETMLFKVGVLLAGNQNQPALELANQMVAKFPGNLQARLSRIEVYLAVNQDAKAKAEVDDILAKNPADYFGIYYRALLLDRAGNAKEAWRLAQNLPADMRDTQPRIAVAIAQIAANVGNMETSASILNRVLLRNPQMNAVRMRLAAIRLRQNNPANALELLTPIKDSGDIRAIELLGTTYVALRRYDDGLAALKRLDVATKGRVEVKRSIALLEIQMGRVDQGIRDLTQLAAKNPENLSLAAPLINALSQQRRYPEALAVAGRLGSYPPQRATALVYRGGILLAQNNIPGALAAYDGAVKADPKSVPALYARANLLSSQWRPAEAMRDLRAILAMDSKNTAALMQLAYVHIQQGDEKNVRALMRQAIAAAPQNPAPKTAWVRYLITQRNFKEALTAVNELVRAHPKNTDGVALLGQIQLALGQKKEAGATYRRLTAMAPTSAAPQVLLGNALAVAGDRTGATRALETAVKLNPKSPEVRGAQIGLQIAQGNVDTAVATAQAFQAANPGVGADLLLADTLDRAGRRDQAAGVLNKSYSDNPSNAALLRLVRFALQANDAKRAGDLMSGWLSKHPADHAVRLEYATHLMQQNDNAGAITQYQAVLKEAPNNVVALNNLGWMLQKSDPKRALSMLTLARKFSPDSADVADTLGWLKLQQKDAAEALALLDHAHKRDPRNGQITYHLAVALDANAKRAEARETLRTLLASGVKFQDLPQAQKLAAAWK
ncbi:MAG TPA: XrtA/PEP-CTERM system TPR-repeat protein PrsT [Rhizomicrobium sp.]|nr:XrtA/PEP-CTERM system TPR-repeat protein PrsT [Rhizomicrobium sp.]